ncbi:MAG TPA: hypothetical protein VGK53_16745 [Propionicimonas sp.]
MSGLFSQVVPVAELTAVDRDTMFALMDLVYVGVTRELFEDDLDGKDECIVLRSHDSTLAGFSTQRFLTVLVDAGRAAPLLGRTASGTVPVDGVFSGDTVIHPDHWGSPALFQAFARRYIVDDGPPRWWFVICKGHRTYRIMPTFFNTFWPNRHGQTPDGATAIMESYAESLYPGDLVEGVLAYHSPKDRLRPGVAGISERELRVPDIAFFAAANPGWVEGHDLVCLCELTPDNLRPAMRPLLLGEAGR